MAGTAGTYFNYPTGSDGVPDGIDFGGDTTFDAVFFDGGSNLEPNDITDVGLLSPYGTAGQGANVWEWEETDSDLLNDLSSIGRGSRGGDWYSNSDDLLPLYRNNNPAELGSDNIGFRVASVIPEPSTLLLCAMTGLGLLLPRRMRKR